MSVATELTRIQSAKAALKTSIRNKGVSVSDDALISAYSALVDAIQTGGGGDTAMKENVQGTLTSYTIPNDVTSIRNCAFYDCRSLASVTIPNSVTSIGENAFNGCIGLTSVTIPNSVTTIGNSAFSGCSSFTSVTIPNGVTSIGSSTFYSCRSLASVTIPNSVTSIGGSAFYSCRSLASVTIPNGVTTIGNSAFQGCSILQAITIPSNVTTIGTNVFRDCSSLKYAKFSGLTPPSISSYSGQFAYMEDILVPQSAVSDYVTKFPLWENRIFADTHTHNYSVTELRYSSQTGSTPFTQLSDTTLNSSNVSKSNLKRIYIGNNVTTIENSTFDHSSSISILIPEVNSLETIETSAFSTGGVIGDLYLPNVTTIGNSAFSHNDCILSVTIGDKITSIGDSAFYSCPKITSFTCLATTPPTLGFYVFDITYCPIYVPAESVETYKAASGWSTYASRIQAIPAE